MKQNKILTFLGDVFFAFFGLIMVATTIRWFKNDFIENIEIVQKYDGAVVQAVGYLIAFLVATMFVMFAITGITLFVIQIEQIIDDIKEVSHE